ncbi:MAG: anaerobic ribonucleoside-triphosphate reductase activating protein [Patescibacteria group bacterium]
MKIGGLQKLTLIDYPGKPACTIFLAGCNLNCPWCHSPDLVVEEKIKKAPEIKKQEFFDFLKKRENVLEGVVICGGEPTVNSDLPELIEEIVDRGYAVKLDTNGTNPQMIERLVKEGLVDYIAMDIKAPFERYKEATGVSVDPKLLRKSISIIQRLDDYEFRTTFIPGLLTKEDLPLMLKEIEGAENYFLQNFRGKRTVNDDYQGKDSFTKEEMKELRKIAEEYVKNCEIR